MPRYADYHRTVVGYHGTKRKTALKIVQGEQEFDPSENADDWLGHGVYFWEYAPQQAWLWAAQRKRAQEWDDEIAVVASMIRLGYCFDLLDPENVKELGQIYQVYKRTEDEAGRTLPTNVMSKKYLNCAAFEFAYASLELTTDEGVDTCRAVFVPTIKADRIWPASGINAHAHIQICVRNMKCILGTWLVKPMEETDDGDGKESKDRRVGDGENPSIGEDPEESIF
jgi:hypothetical protein